MAIHKGAHLLCSVVWDTEPCLRLGASPEPLGPLAPSVSLPLAVEPAFCSLDLSFPTDSVRPHRWQPTRLPLPWNSPGKNTAVQSGLYARGEREPVIVLESW